MPPEDEHYKEEYANWKAPDSSQEKSEIEQDSKPKDLEKNEKERLWDEVANELEDVGDKRGLGIDEGIKEAVTAFKVNGLNTTQSCEGHVDESSLSPWVQFEAPNRPESKFVGEEDKYSEVAGKYGIPVEDVKRANNVQAWREVYGYFEGSGQPTVEFQKWQEDNNKQKERAISFLEDFYTERLGVDDDVKLVLVESDDSIRVHNGGENYIVTSELEKLRKEKTKEELTNILLTRQEEMGNFTKFLKQRFFNTP